MKYILILAAALVLSGCVYSSQPCGVAMGSGVRTFSLWDAIMGGAFKKPICCPEDCKVVCPDGWKVCDGGASAQQMVVAPANAKILVTPGEEPRVTVSEWDDIPKGAKIRSRTVTRYSEDAEEPTVEVVEVIEPAAKEEEAKADANCK